MLALFPFSPSHTLLQPAKGSLDVERWLFPPATPYTDGFFAKKCLISWRISLRSLLRGTVKLVCYV